mmetsp:Transcript_34490/g.51181  ORF Transcript_34490/g.51181 Transcript_34490/m.51181 type:complete len:112 (-) Transcript_34490:44-379(-)
MTSQDLLVLDGTAVKPVIKRNLPSPSFSTKRGLDAFETNQEKLFIRKTKPRIVGTTSHAMWGIFRSSHRMTGWSRKRTRTLFFTTYPVPYDAFPDQYNITDELLLPAYIHM